MKILDEKLSEINSLEKEKSLLDGIIKKRRNELMDIIKKEDVQTYSNEFATVSHVQRKNVVIENLPDVLYRLKDQKLEKYIEVVKNISKGMKEDIKSGKFVFEGVKVETKEYPQIRFVKERK